MSDAVVILARGASRRMGYPKGLHRLREGGPTLLELVAAPYRRRGWPVLVVALETVVAGYRQVAGGLVSRWIAAPGGGGTARTCLTALPALPAGTRRCWFHPVDLPHVLPSTRQLLLDAARRHPDTVLVPTWRGRRGHPVVVPRQLLEAARGARPTGSMAAFMTDRGWPLLFLPVPDPGCVNDVDEPGPD